jgi:hypothetical protein
MRLEVGGFVGVEKRCWGERNLYFFMFGLMIGIVYVDFGVNQDEK